MTGYCHDVHPFDPAHNEERRECDGVSLYRLTMNKNGYRIISWRSAEPQSHLLSNVPVRSAHGFAARTPNTGTPKHLQTSMRHNSTIMSAIDKALAAIELRELGDEIIYQQYADKYNVLRSALNRRHRGVSRSRADYTADKQSLAPQQELELVRYIKTLTERGLPPTREMIRNFSSEVAYQLLSESWVTRFINRHEIHLI